MSRAFSLSLALSLVGCAARHPLCHEPAPAQAAWAATSADGLCLQGYQWTPEAMFREPRGVVVVVHGLRDHAGRYEALAQALTDRGLLVVAQDHRGHGRSGGKRQRFDAIDQLQQDLQGAVERGRSLAPGKPVFLFGHSLGGLVVTRYALAHGDKLSGMGLSGMVLSGAALQLPDGVKPSEVRGAKLLGALTPGLRVQELDDTQFVREPEAKAELASDPLVDHFRLPAASARAIVLGIESLRLQELSVPVLALHGTADTATSPDGSRKLVEVAPVADKTLRLYEGAHHDLLHEPEGPAIVSEVVDWVAARLPDAPPADAAER